MALPASIANNLNKDFETCALIKIEFDGITFAVTDAPFSIEHNSINYLPSDLIIGTGDIKKTAETKVNDITLTFSSVDQTITALMLSNGQIGREVMVYRVYFYRDEFDIKRQYIEELAIGEISGFTNSSNTEASAITLNVASLFADWQRKSGRVTTVASQKRYFPNDDGMEWANQVQDDLKWGGE